MFKKAEGEKVYLNDEEIKDIVSDNEYVTAMVPLQACTVEIK